MSCDPQPSTHRPPAATGRTRTAWLVLGGLNFLLWLSVLPPWSLWLRGLDVGLLEGHQIAAVASQLGLLAMWGALGTGRFYVRLPATAALGFALLVGCNFCQRWAWDLSPWTEWAAKCAASSLFLLFLLTPVPALIWLLRAVRGWRLMPAAAAAARRQFSLRDLLAAAVLAAVALALGRWMATSLREEIAYLASEIGWEDSLFPMGALIAFAGMTALSVWVVLAAGRHPRGRFIGLIVLAAGPLWAAGAWGLAVGLIDSESLVRLGLIVAEWEVLLLANLWLLRWGGYRLTRPGAVGPPPAEPLSAVTRP